MSETEPEADAPIELREPFIRLGRDMKVAARGLARRDARWLTDQYYTIQDARIRSASQKRTNEEAGEPCMFNGWVFTSMMKFEGVIKAGLGEFAAQYKVGQWMQAQFGIGPVLSAALLSNFDIRKAPTVGHMWRFCGLDPTLKWLGKASTKFLTDLGVDKELTSEQASKVHDASGQHQHKIRDVFDNGFYLNGKHIKGGKTGLAKLLALCPWNADLKAICAYRLGECFVKFSGADKCYYGKLYAAKKVALMEANEAGQLNQQAERELASKNYGKTTEAYKRLIQGMLPQAQIHAQARRYAVKLFLSHLHHVMYRDYHNQDPPAPYIFEHPNGEDHRHLLLPPLWPGEYDGKGLADMKD